MKIAFSTIGTPDWSWGQILERGTAYGFDGVEIRLLENETNLLVREEFQAGVLAKRREELDACGFRVCGLASNVRFDAPEPAVRAEQVEIGKAYIDLARELGARLGVSSQFVVRKTLAQARRHSWQDIRWRYRRLLEADLAIKQGRLEPDLALELLAADQAAHTHR